MSTMSADEVMAMVEQLANLPYGLEPVDQRAHAYQTAGFAISAGGDDELIAAALLHDIGRHETVERQFPEMPHEESARVWLALHFPERVAWLVGAHVPAKRYLVATDHDYYASLSEGSVASFAYQDGPMSADEIAEFERHPWHADAVALRRWDDLAKVPGAVEPATERVRRSVAAALDAR
jgi:gamma-butyrobetaine dioxygenase